MAELAARGVFVGTSSWKYRGWCGTLYDEARYIFRGRLAESRFEKNCLAEYAQVFKTVSVDAAYYKFPDQRYLQELVSSVPEDFRFGFKVTDEITIKRFKNLPRFAARAGQANPNFLNADLFLSAFLAPMVEFRANVGLIMFEFSRFWPSDYQHGRDFVSDLDAFFTKLPKGWPYAVEMRNKQWLVPDYFACLARHGVTHVFNSWEAMPSVTEQFALPGSVTNPSLVAARFLLKPGRSYEEAVKAFQPYDRTQEVNEEARAIAARLVAEGVLVPHRRTYLYVNNRLEGNSLNTITAMLRRAEQLISSASESST